MRQRGAGAGTALGGGAGASVPHPPPTAKPPPRCTGPPSPPCRYPRSPGRAVRQRWLRSAPVWAGPRRRGGASSKGAGTERGLAPLRPYQAGPAGGRGHAAALAPLRPDFSDAPGRSLRGEAGPEGRGRGRAAERPRVAAEPLPVPARPPRSPPCWRTGLSPGFSRCHAWGRSRVHPPRRPLPFPFLFPVPPSPGRFRFHFSAGAEPSRARCVGRGVRGWSCPGAVVGAPGGGGVSREGGV